MKKEGRGLKRKEGGRRGRGRRGRKRTSKSRGEGAGDRREAYLEPSSTATEHKEPRD
jgi:hypothetical protein